MVGMQINTYIVAYLVLTSFFTALNLALNELNIVNVRLRWLFDSFNQLPQLQHSYVVLVNLQNNKTKSSHKKIL